MIRNIAIVENTLKYILNTYGKGSHHKLMDFYQKKTLNPEWLSALKKCTGFLMIRQNGRFYYFLADDLNAYHDIDFEQSYLRYWYESGPGNLKKCDQLKDKKKR